MNKYWFLIILPVLSLIGYSQPVGYTYGKQITINASQIPGTAAMTNFPVLISLTDPLLRTVENGGHVQNANGYDILFTLSDCTAFLDFQIEKYNPVTGQLIAWVRVPSLSATANTILHMYYGNSSVSVNPSTTATWNANYFGVYHFNNTVNDASATGNNLTNVNSSNLTASIIGDGRDLNNSTNVLSSVTTGQHLVVPNGVLAGITNFTWSGWVYLDRDATNWERIFDFGQSTNVNFFFTASSDATSPSQTRVRITTGGTGSEQGPAINNPSANTGAWNYWAVTLNATSNTVSVYKNGALYGSATGVTFRPNNMEASTSNFFGRSNYNADHYIDGKFDEFRLSRAVHSANWITTEYNNQNAPSSFYSVGSEVNANVLCVVLPVELIDFNATATETKTVELNWSTASEFNNDYFSVERSVNGEDWEQVLTVDGAGNSLITQNYHAVDYQPLAGLSYYRLKQTDLNGHFSYSEIRSVYFAEQQVLLYPNPAKDAFTLYMAQPDWSEVGIYTIPGQDVTASAALLNTTTHTLVIDIARLHPGTYIVRTGSSVGLLQKL